MKKKNHVVDENVFIVIISYSYLERKKCSKYVMIQAADEMHKKKDSFCYHEDGKSAPFTVVQFSISPDSPWVSLWVSSKPRVSMTTYTSIDFPQCLLPANDFTTYFHQEN